MHPTMSANMPLDDQVSDVAGLDECLGGDGDEYGMWGFPDEPDSLLFGAVTDTYEADPMEEPALPDEWDLKVSHLIGQGVPAAAAFGLMWKTGDSALKDRALVGIIRWIDEFGVAGIALGAAPLDFGDAVRTVLHYRPPAPL